jgi:hypothetical protein
MAASNEEIWVTLKMIFIGLLQKEVTRMHTIRILEMVNWIITPRAIDVTSVPSDRLPDLEHQQECPVLKFSVGHS